MIAATIILLSSCERKRIYECIADDFKLYIMASQTEVHVGDVIVIRSVVQNVSGRAIFVTSDESATHVRFKLIANDEIGFIRLRPENEVYDSYMMVASDLNEKMGVLKHPKRRQAIGNDGFGGYLFPNHSIIAGLTEIVEIADEHDYEIWSEFIYGLYIREGINIGQSEKITITVLGREES